ncbi:MAG: hypothetical protein QOE90_3223 [Thermoplasmata archaeon]|jgi:hypothetical protein|nr:hypothetical protein [Thermoplasmata archaeon]
MDLENPPENPCFGCGPQHARGLRLAFRREGDELVTTHAPQPDEVGWPGLFHTGLHFTLLYEVSYWAALELTGKVMTSFGPATFDQERLPRVGAATTARARIVATDPLTVEARTTSAEGKTQATLRTTWRAASRARTERAGIALPGYLTDSMEP